MDFKRSQPQCLTDEGVLMFTESDEVMLRAEIVHPLDAHWIQYKQGKNLKLSEAILLSMDILPSWYFAEGYISKSFRILYWPEYTHRLVIARKRAFDADWLLGEKPGNLNEISDDTVIDLAKFTDCVNSEFKWDVPKEFNNSRLTQVQNKPIKELKIGLPKARVAYIFNGLKWDEAHWNKNLACPSKKLEICIIKKGKRGNRKHSTIWDPVQIAVYLIDEKFSINKINKVFRELPEWKALWEEQKEYLNLDADV